VGTIASSYTYLYKKFLLKLEQKITIGLLKTQLKILSLISVTSAAEKAFQIFCSPRKISGRKTPPIFQSAETLDLQINSNKIVGYRWNHHEGSKKVLIIHGFESTCKNFGQYITIMISKGYEVLAFDAPAHGESEGKQINVVIYKDMLEKIYETFGPIHAFIAHSFGGLAISLALEKISHSHEVKLVLIAPATETSTAVDILFEMLQLNGKIRSAFDKLIVEVGQKPVEWYSISRALTNIKGQILWVHDEEDTVTPFKDVQPIMEKKLPNLRFVVTKGWGHRRIYREEKVIEEISSFLELPKP
jgi:pimeloyl-ACP methyl ester carboxylesterase